MCTPTLQLLHKITKHITIVELLQTKGCKWGNWTKKGALLMPFAPYRIFRKQLLKNPTNLMKTIYKLISTIN